MTNGMPSALPLPHGRGSVGHPDTVVMSSSFHSAPDVRATGPWGLPCDQFSCQRSFIARLAAPPDAMRWQRLSMRAWRKIQSSARFSPSTFKCAIEEFSAFLVQFLGGEADATQRRWWLSLRESHSRFRIGPRERHAWLTAMTATLEDESIIADAQVRSELLAFFQRSSAHVVNTERIAKPEQPLTGELAPLWDEQLALDDAVALIHSPGKSVRCIEVLQSPLLQSRFARSPAVHASLLALAAKSKAPALREFVVNQIRVHPSLIHERYSGGRTLLHDASAAGDLDFVELLLDMGAGKTSAHDEGDPLAALLAVANGCSVPGGGRISPGAFATRPHQSQRNPWRQTLHRAAYGGTARERGSDRGAPRPRRGHRSPRQSGRHTSSPGRQLQ